MNRRHLLQGIAAFGLSLTGTAAFAKAHHAARPTKSFPPIPQGYLDVAKLENVPAIVLYGVALQESQKLFGNVALPYPWTLNIAGVGKRYSSYEASVAALRDSVARGVKSVDCGLMQVNWLYHHEKLQNYHTALDPYPNLQAGAKLLHEQYAACKNWFTAIGRYHNQRDHVRANAYAAQVYQHMQRVPA